jgi:hypothetical protein
LPTGQKSGRHTASLTFAAWVHSLRISTQTDDTKERPVDVSNVLRDLPSYHVRTSWTAPVWP